MVDPGLVSPVDKPTVRCLAGVVKIILPAMRRTHFHKPVIIQPGRIDRDRVVTTVAEAARILIHQWPVPTCEKRRAAMQACLDVIKGDRMPGHARLAFIDAAKQARILVGDLV